MDERSGRRHLIATGVTAGLDESGDRIVESVAVMADLLVGEFGYDRVPGLGIDPTKDEMEKGVRDFCGRCAPDDLLVIYHTGHGDFVSGRHRLWMGDATGDRLIGTIPTADLVEAALLDTELRSLLLIIDVCFAGRGGAQSLVAGMEASSRSTDKSLTVLTAAHPLEQIRAGDFAALFTEAVHHQATAGHEPRYLTPEALAEYMKSSPNRKTWQTISCSTLFGSAQNQRFFVNPRYDPRLHGFDVLSQLIIAERTAREEDLRSHFLPRARGVDVPTEVAWRFVGRHAALGELTRWLSDAAAGTLRVVTGDPGSGKSAVLARLAVLSEPEWRSTVPLDGVPDETVPAAGSIGVAVHARGKTAGQILAALAAAAEANASTPGELLRTVRQGGGLAAIIDAVDETVDPEHVVSWLLQPLIRGAEAAGLRLVLGTRKHLVHRLGPPEQTLDLDAPEYADRPSLRRYASRCLRESTPDSPFRDLPGEVVEPVAAAVAAAAGRSFLVALIVSRTLAAGDRIPDAADPAWRASLPGTAADAMQQDLETRLGAEAERARELLRPLAYAHGAGLPWAGTWAPLASELSGKLHTDEDIVWLMRNAGAYVIEALEEGSSVYRLYHLSMAEYLRTGQSNGDVHAAFVTYLEGRVPDLAPGHRDWTRAPAYTRAHLATHARAAGAFGRFVTDGLYLAMAGPAAVIAALPALTGAAEAAAAAVYQRTLHLMRGATVAERLSYLELWGLRLGADALVAHVRGCPVTRPWSTDWGQWPLEHPHRVLPGHKAAISSVTVPALEPPTAITVGRDGALCVWDLKTAEPLVVRDLGGASLLSVRTVVPPDGPGLVAVLGADLKLHRMDVGTWTPRETIAAAPWPRRAAARLSDPSPVLMCGRLADGRLAAFVGGKGCPAAVWDLRSGERLSVLRGAGPFWTPVAFAETRDRRPVLLMRRSTGPQAAFQYWDVTTGRSLIPVAGRTTGSATFHAADAVYFRDAAERPVAVIGFGRRVRCWDLVRGGEIYSADGLLPGAGTAEIQAVTKRVHEIVARRYPDAEPVVGKRERPGELAIDRVTDGTAGRCGINGVYTDDDGQVLRIDLTVNGSEPEITLSGHTARIAEVAAAAVHDRTVMVTVSADGSARLWDLDAIARLAPGERLGRSSSPVYRVAVGGLPGGDRVLLTLGAAGVILWDARLGTVRAELAGPGASGSSAVTLVDDGTGRLSAAAFGAHGVAGVWDAETGEPMGAAGIHPLGWTIGTAALKRDDGTVALVTTGHGDFSLAWELPAWSLRKVLRGHAGWSADVDCGRDHRGRPIAVTAGTDGRVCVWNLTTFRGPRRLRSFRRWRSLAGRTSLHALAVRLLTGVFPARMAALLLADGGVQIIDLGTGRFTGGVRADAAHLATAALTDGRSVIVTATDRGLVTAWEVSVRSIGRRPAVRLEPAARIDLEVPLNSVELEPDGLLVVGTAHGISCLRLPLEPDPAPR
ncbi:hypothetical protein ETD83_23820 [Actinomadura soli]|uniref:Peptidase C14 caspase domain-containing protein n=1 Tax=Actinomadura soli TaxID=2508997 RepID=A0A5C4JA06_9ACTN|nr:hypothetical protein [Actinomadura soli]TMQ94548.1 hypothetical protein ETD83_23820 [Actinomadura soli]